MIAEQLRKNLGIEFTLEAVDPATTVDRTIRGTPHASLIHALASSFSTRPTI